MTQDPWKPPAGWDQIAPEVSEGPWTVGRVLKAMGRAFRGQPLGVFLAVCVLPGIWEVPATIDVPRGEFFSLLDAICLPLYLYLGARTCLWTPILVDARRPFWDGAMESWVLTWGSVSKLLVVAGILVTVMLPFVVVEAAFSDHFHVGIAMLTALFVLALAAYYTLVYPPAAIDGVSASSNREP